MAKLTFTRTIQAGLLGLMALGLAACAADEGPPPPCPEIRILGGAEKLTRFRPGNGRDIIDVVHEEQITGFKSYCEYDFEDDGSSALTVLIAPQVLSERGPANTKGTSNFEYFIALTDSKKKIIKRDSFGVDLTYSPTIPRLAWQRPDPYEITLALKPNETGRKYRFYIGLKLSRDELEHQLKTR